MFAPMRRQIAVQFHHGERTQSLHQRLGERTQAWANFDHVIAGLRMNPFNDLLDQTAINQKMLAKAFARNVFHSDALNSCT
jgi:hypothetical protein